MNRKQQIINRVLFVLALIGIAIAIYVLQSWLRETPIVCLTNGCETVRKHAASYIYGIPVPAVGLVGYTLLAVFSFLRTTSTNPVYLKLMAALSGFGVSFIAWFTYTEIYVIGAICTWCAISGLNMVIVFGLVMKSLSLGRNK